MAYMSQEHKQQIAAELKKVIPAGWKYSLGVRHHSTLCLTISAAPVDLIGEWVRNTDARYKRTQLVKLSSVDVNPYHVRDQFDTSRDTFIAILAAMNAGNWDRSDPTVDYFDVGHYVSIKIGKWDKPFVCTETVAA